MTLLRDLGIATRLKIGFAGILVLLTALTVIAINQVNRINNSLAEINDVR